MRPELVAAVICVAACIVILAGFALARRRMGR